MGTSRSLGNTTSGAFRLSGLVVCTALLVAMICATSASAAKTICLGTTTPAACAGNSVADLTAAVAATASSETNTIYIGAGEYSTLLGADFGGHDVRLIGVGSVRPVISASAPLPTSSVLRLANSDSSIENVSVAIPSGSVGVSGIVGFGGQSLTDVAVSGSAVAGAVGIDLSGGRQQLNRVSVELTGVGSVGAQLHDAFSTELADVKISGATTAIELDSIDEFALERLRLQTAGGLDIDDSSGAISSSLVIGGGISIEARDGESHGVEVDNCTVVGSAGAGFVSAADFPGSTSDVIVDSTAITGFSVSASAESAAGGDGELQLIHSAFDGAVEGGVGLGAGNLAGLGDFGFADAEHRLTLDSPLVDAGSTTPRASASGTDLDGAPRTASRGAGIIRDIGAFELQNRPPEAVVSVVTAAPSTTSPTEFSAAGSSDADGDALSFDWTFDGLPAPNTLIVRRQFPMPGLHTARLTVTDAAGAVKTVWHQFHVAKGFLAMRISAQSGTLGGNGALGVTLTCPVTAISDCQGRVVLETLKRVDAKRYKKSRKKKRRRARATRKAPLVAASYVFSIPPAESRWLKLRASSTFLNLLDEKGKVELVGSLDSATTQNAVLTSNRAIVTVRSARRR